MKRYTLLVAAVASLAFAVVADAQCWGGRRCRNSCRPACGTWNNCGTMCSTGCGTASWGGCNSGCGMVQPCGGMVQPCGAMVQPCGQTMVAYANPCCNIQPCGGMVVQGNVMPGTYVMITGQPVMMTGNVMTANVSSPMPAPGQVVQASHQEKKDGTTTPSTSTSSTAKTTNTTNVAPMVVVPQGMVVQTGMVQPCGNTNVQVIPVSGCHDTFYTTQPCNNYYPVQRFSRVRYFRGSNCGGCY